MRNENSWRLFNSHEAELQQLLRLNGGYENELFIKTALYRNRELSETDREKFIAEIGTTIFYCIWDCRVNRQCMHDVIRAFFEDCITIGIMKTLYSRSKKSWGVSKDTQHSIVKETAVSMGKNSLKTTGYPYYYKLIAAIVGYEGDGTPYDCADELISQRTFESDVIAAHILSLAISLKKHKFASRLGYGIKSGGLAKYSEFILRGILDDAHKGMQLIYLQRFWDVFLIGEASIHEEIWFQETVFEHILRIAISQYKGNGDLLDKYHKKFNPFFRHISLYPCKYSVFCKKLLKKMDYDPFMIDKIDDVFRSTYRFIMRTDNLLMSEDNLLLMTMAGKLLILFWDISDFRIRKMLYQIVEATRKLGYRVGGSAFEELYRQMVIMLTDGDYA